MRDDFRSVNAYNEALALRIVVYGDATIAVGQKAFQDREVSLRSSAMVWNAVIGVYLTRLWAWPHL